MPDYTLVSLPCWEAGCPYRFDVFTDLSNHHLEAHEELLFGRGADGWLAEWPPVPAEAPSDDCYICAHDHLVSLLCSRCGPNCQLCIAAQEAYAAQTEATSVAAPSTALDVFQAQCRDAGAPCQDLAAGLLLERFGVYPGALAADCDAAIREAVARWVACAAPQGHPGPAPGWRWQTGSTDGHDYAHVETPECVEAGCRFIAGPKQA